MVRNQFAERARLEAQLDSRSIFLSFLCNTAEIQGACSRVKSKNLSFHPRWAFLYTEMNLKENKLEKRGASSVGHVIERERERTGSTHDDFLRAPSAILTCFNLNLDSEILFQKSNGPKGQKILLALSILLCADAAILLSRPAGK